MKRKQKITISVIGLFIILLALIGITFGYFLTNIKGNTNNKSIDVLSAYLELTYEDGNGTIKKENIEPGNIIEEKTFTVTNTGSLTIDNYGVYLEEVINTFKNKDDVTYTLTCASSKSGKTCNGVDETTYPSLNELLVTNSIDKNEVHTYTLKVVFKETGKDQSIDMNKKIEGRVQIYDQKDVVYLTGEVTGYKEGDYVLVESNPKKSQIVDGKYKVVGLKPATHSIKVVGSDNVVKGTKNFEVIKGNEESIVGDVATITNNSEAITINVTLKDDSIDLTIDKVSGDTGLYTKGTLANAIYTSAIDAAKDSSETIRTIFNKNPLTNITTQNSAADERILSITEDDYGTSYYYRGAVHDNYLELNGLCFRIMRIQGDGSIKITLAKAGLCSSIEETDTMSALVNEGSKQVSGSFSFEGGSVYNELNNWYNTYLSDISDKIKKETWCLGGQKSKYSEFGALIADENISDYNYYYYETGKRLRAMSQPRESTLICASEADRVINYIGTLTADELVYAGVRSTGSESSANKTFYLYDNAQYNYWTLSRCGNGLGKNSVFRMDRTGYLSDYYIQFNLTAGIRPVISLKSGIKIVGGDGTKNNPYEVKLD